VRYTLEPLPNGTRLVFEHTGFKGFGGFVLAKFILEPGWKKSLGGRFARVLTDVDERGALRATSTLQPLF
jgi:hypothetical protein